jgi:hypothetical protein
MDSHAAWCQGSSAYHYCKTSHYKRGSSAMASLTHRSYGAEDMEKDAGSGGSVPSAVTTHEIAAAAIGGTMVALTGNVLSSERPISIAFALVACFEAFDFIDNFASVAGKCAFKCDTNYSMSAEVNTSIDSISWVSLGEAIPRPIFIDRLSATSEVPANTCIGPKRKNCWVVLAPYDVAMALVEVRPPTFEAAQVPFPPCTLCRSPSGCSGRLNLEGYCQPLRY